MTESEGLYLKYLRLITPDLANNLGVPAEAPVLVSPNIKEPHTCQCGIEYKPLVYSKGVVRSHHFHEYGGGIYLAGQYSPGKAYEGTIYESRNMRSIGLPPPGGFFNTITEPWGAIVTTIGRVSMSYDRAEAVAIRQLWSFCCQHGEPLDEGIAIPLDNLDFNSSTGMLLPFCKEGAYTTEAAYEFRVAEDGSLVFSLPSLP